MLFFVAPEVEEIAGRVSSDSGDTVTLTFAKLFYALQKNRSTGGNGWVAPDGQDQYDEWGCAWHLPRTITLVMWLDPEMSADCALALVGIVKWAVQVSQDDADVSVLTMDVGKDDILSKVVSFVSPTSNVAHFDLAAEAQQEPLTGSLIHEDENLANVAGNILKCFREAPDRKRLVISFASELHHEMKKQFQNHEGRAFQFGYINENTAGATLKWLKRPSKASITRVVIFTCAACILPFEIKDLDEAHLVLGSKIRSDKVWDNSCAEVITTSRWTSKEGRRLQLWWARQTSAKDRHVYTAWATVHLFTQGGSRHHLVENAQIGGFIASAVDLVTWGIDLDGVLACFILYPSRYMELMERLKRQGIINPDSNGLALSNNEAFVFRAILPCFDYDYRLALMVSLDCPSFVRRVKVRLAVILSVGTANLVTLNTTQNAGADARDKVIAAGLGISSTLRNEGFAWLVLSLLNRYSRITSQGSSTEALEFKDLVSVDESKLTRMTDQLLGIIYSLMDIRFDLDAPWEFHTLWPEDKRQIRSHLLRSSMYQITMVRYKKVDGKRLPEHGLNFNIVAGPTDCGVSKLKSPSLISLYDAAHQLKMGGGFAYVFAHNLYRSRDGKLFCLLWTFIPVEFVRKWLWQSASKCPFQLLDTGVQHT